MSYELPDEGDSEIRKRAAWLLGMLALVAALFVGFMITFVGHSGGGSDNNNADPVVPSSTSPAFSSPPSARSTTATTPTHPPTTSRSTTPRTTAAPRGSASCPSPARCALTGDIGNAIVAVNAYRTQHGQPVLPGRVAADARTCALTDGSDCPDAFAETTVPAPDGASAVAKIESRAKLLEPGMTAFGVGWAYDPGSKTYYFAVVRDH